MSDKVVALRGNAVHGGANEWVLAGLKQALDEAKAGEIAAIGWIKVRPNGDVSVGYRGQPGMRHNHLVAAGCAYLAHDIAADSNERLRP